MSHQSRQQQEGSSASINIKVGQSGTGRNYSTKNESSSQAVETAEWSVDNQHSAAEKDPTAGHGGLKFAPRMAFFLHLFLRNLLFHVLPSHECAYVATINTLIGWRQTVI